MRARGGRRERGHLPRRLHLLEARRRVGGRRLPEHAAGPPPTSPPPPPFSPITCGDMAGKINLRDLDPPVFCFNVNKNDPILGAGGCESVYSLTESFNLRMCYDDGDASNSKCTRAREARLRAALPSAAPAALPPSPPTHPPPPAECGQMEGRFHLRDLSDSTKHFCTGVTNTYTSPYGGCDGVYSLNPATFRLNLCTTDENDPSGEACVSVGGIDCAPPSAPPSKPPSPPLLPPRDAVAGGGEQPASAFACNPFGEDHYPFAPDGVNEASGGFSWVGNGLWAAEPGGGVSGVAGAQWSGCDAQGNDVMQFKSVDQCIDECRQIKNGQVQHAVLPGCDAVVVVTLSGADPSSDAATATNVRCRCYSGVSRFQGFSSYAGTSFWPGEKETFAWMSY